jgi:hypothetical protein
MSCMGNMNGDYGEKLYDFERDEVRKLRVEV